MTSRGDDAIVARNARNIALSTSLIVFALSIVLWVDFDPSTPAFQFVERTRWASSGGFTITYHMGIYGFSLFLAARSTLLTMRSAIACWTSGTIQAQTYTTTCI